MLVSIVPHFQICISLHVTVIVVDHVLVVAFSDQNMMYQAEVTTPTSRETYIGLCDTTFKLRYRNHVCSFKNERYKHATELSKYIWSLKDKSIPHNIKWRKVKQARSYSNISKRCNLCLWEKYFIIYKPDMSTLNNRSELIF